MDNGAANLLYILIIYKINLLYIYDQQPIKPTSCFWWSQKKKEKIFKYLGTCRFNLLGNFHPGRDDVILTTENLSEFSPNNDRLERI